MKQKEIKKYYVWEDDSRLSNSIAFESTHPTIIIKKVALEKWVIEHDSK